MLCIRDLNVVKSNKSICQVSQLEMVRGDRVAIVGNNGCGKTTLLRVISGLECEFEGQCQIEVAQTERVYLHQFPYLFRGTALFNAAYGLTARKTSRRESHRLAHEWLEVFGVNHLAHRRCGYLSGGERRRVALARAFAPRPALLLLDEPLADLDPTGIDLVCQALTLLPKTTIVVSSPNPLPDFMALRVVAM